MKFVFNNRDKITIVEEDDKHKAISKYVKHLGADMSDFYYGLDDGQIQILEVNEEI